VAKFKYNSVVVVLARSAQLIWENAFALAREIVTPIILS
jgi:hypothetical protein